MWGKDVAHACSQRVPPSLWHCPSSYTQRRRCGPWHLPVDSRLIHSGSMPVSIQASAAVLRSGTLLSCARMQGEKQEPNTDFKPNLVNTVCFLVQFIIQLMTFAVNYQVCFLTH